MNAEPRRLRVGRKVGRTLYTQVGNEPSDSDVLVGLLDTPDLAAEIAALSVRVREAEQRAERAERELQPPLGDSCFEWLIERGQPEGEPQTVWLEHNARHVASEGRWTILAHESAMFPSKELAEAYIAEQGLTARAVEHGFMVALTPLERAEAAEQREASLRSALEMMLVAFRAHNRWCGYRGDAPGDGIFNEAVRLAEAALASSSGAVCAKCGEDRFIPGYGGRTGDVVPCAVCGSRRLVFAPSSDASEQP